VGAGQLLLPATIGIVEGSSASEPVTIKVLGRLSTQANKLVVLSEVVTTVPDGRLALLRMPLQWLCDGQAVDGQSGDLATNDSTATSSCSGNEQSCVAGTCTSEVVDSTKLPDYNPTQVFGGASAPGTSGQCFDTLGCFSAGYVEPVDPTDCTMVEPSGGSGVNVALVLPLGGAGICDDHTCLVPLDQGPDGWSDLGNGRLQLPTAVCTLKSGTTEGLAVTTSCATNTPATPTCGPWSSASSNLGTIDAAAPDGAGPAVTGSSDGGPPEDAAPPFDAGSDAPSICAAFSINQSACGVIANTGCPGMECAASTSSDSSFCTATGAVGINGACTPGGSPAASCGPGLFCIGGIEVDGGFSCAPYCCSAEDCLAEAGFNECAQLGVGVDGGGTFGVCGSF